MSWAPGTRPIDQLIQIAAAGGGMTVDANTQDLGNLVRLAAAARDHSARIHIVNAARFDTQALVQIAVAGKGAVTFDLL